MPKHITTNQCQNSDGWWNSEVNAIKGKMMMEVWTKWKTAKTGDVVLSSALLGNFFRLSNLRPDFVVFFLVIGSLVPSFNKDFLAGKYCNNSRKVIEKGGRQKVLKDIKRWKKRKKVQNYVRRLKVVEDVEKR